MDFQIPDEARLKYIERRKKDIETCKTAILNQDYKVLETLGHQIKGNAASYGFDNLAPIAANLEETAKEKDLDKINVVLDSFEAAVETLKI
jgi:HPt (histidine-containing phosphotransfer) domain-containing protein